MSADKIRASLLSKGYFPKELPPAFTTKDFGSNCDEILVNWESNKLYSVDLKSISKTQNKRKRKKAYLYKLNDAEAEIMSMPKRGYERRNIHIVHPLPQVLIVKEISEHWPTIHKWLSKSASVKIK